MEYNEKGIVRIIIMGGGIANQYIGKINEDVDETCAYCNAGASTIGPIIWVCPYSERILNKLDPLLARAPMKYLLPSIQSGIAPAMQVVGERRTGSKLSRTTWMKICFE